MYKLCQPHVRLMADRCTVYAWDVPGICKARAWTRHASCKNEADHKHKLNKISLNVFQEIYWVIKKDQPVYKEADLFFREKPEQITGALPGYRATHRYGGWIFP